MARFRRRARSRVSRMSRRARSRGSSSYKWYEVLATGALVGIGRSALAPVIPNFFEIGPVDSDNAIFGGAGVFLMHQPNKYMKLAGLIALGQEGSIVAAKAMQGMTGTSSNGMSAYDNSM